ncbi:MAG: hypothetical protein HY332_03720 [Chloroflexi bacterium]|nr:hypothetical protein [Chloroflexota bacterium]
MVLQQRAETTAEAEQSLAAYLDQLTAMVRARYPDAEFRFGPGHEPSAWLIWARIPVEDDLELEHSLAERSTDFLVEHGVAISVIIVPKQD